MVLGDASGRVGQGRRGDHVRRGRHQLTGQFHTGAGGIDGRKAAFGSGVEVDQLQGLGDPARVRLLAEALVFVEAEPHRFSTDAGGFCGLSSRPGQVQAEAALTTDGGLGGPGGGAAQALGIDSIALAQAQHHQALRAPTQGRDHQLVPGLAFELLLLEGIGDAGKALFQGSCRGIDIALGKPHRQHIAVPLLQTGGGQGEAHGWTRQQRMSVAILCDALGPQSSAVKGVAQRWRVSLLNGGHQRWISCCSRARRARVARGTSQLKRMLSWALSSQRCRASP